MSEGMEHRHLREDECPRCGGSNTISYGRETGNVTESHICLDCKKKDPCACAYSVIHDDGIESVQWGGEDGCENEVFDTEYLARREAKGLLEVAEAALHYIETPGDFTDQERVDLEQDLAERIRRAKGQSDE
jgi:hypothetical protein